MHLREADLEAAISRGSRDLLQGSCALGPKPLGLSVLTQQRRGPRSPSAGRHHPLCPRGATRAVTCVVEAPLAQLLPP